MTAATPLPIPALAPAVGQEAGSRAGALSSAPVGPCCSPSSSGRGSASPKRLRLQQLVPLPPCPTQPNPTQRSPMETCRPRLLLSPRAPLSHPPHPTPPHPSFSHHHGAYEATFHTESAAFAKRVLADVSQLPPLLAQHSQMEPVHMCHAWTVASNIFVTVSYFQLPQPLVLVPAQTASGKGG